MLHIEHNTGMAPALTHHHNAYEILFIQEGAIHIHIRGRTLEAGEGTLVFLSNLEEHAVTVIRMPYDRYFLTVPAPLADAWLRSPALLSIFKNRPAGFRNTVDVREMGEEIRRLFEEILSESKLCDPFGEMCAKSLLTLLLAKVFRLRSEAFPYNPQTSGTAIDIQRYLDAHLTEPLSISSLAKRFFLSPDYLSHLFKKATGYSPKQYITFSRLALARSLVGEGLSVKEAAGRAGFTDANHFIKQFRTRYGDTPGRAAKRG